MKLTVLPLTIHRWPDLEAIFAAKGCSVARGCWCMCDGRMGLVIQRVIGVEWQAHSVPVTVVPVASATSP